jgi:uncharacterized protein
MIDPFRFVKSGDTLEREIQLTPTGRLQGVISQTSTVTLVLNPNYDAPRGQLEGQISGEVVRQCQVCMDNLVQPVAIDFMLCPVSSEEQAEQLDERYEPLVVIDDQVELEDIVTDEVILNLRATCSHIDVTGKECKSDDDFSVGEIPKEKKPSPFEVLKSVKLK